MAHTWEGSFDADDERDDEGEEWKREAREPAASDGETVEHLLAAIDVVLYDRNGRAVELEEPRAYDLLVRAGCQRAANRSYAVQRRIAARWPRLCDCGREFRGPQPQMTRCPTCRARPKKGRA